ncbi:uncharacterized protein BDW47DRAFT_102616 [Aspergillus candidus]|uniref:Transmembrane protein n=1 Tax=Aspergillus candidus TaxID=41067 RepID=A0A2I2FH03_ASPCN|nr:hypothetical protein BDW47DRAFT_102616 [Aspergillus candidus]PLB39880.1 hypothetical protein BDW47DRAFT_102616 [Aspergillus candidus]
MDGSSVLRTDTFEGDKKGLRSTVFRPHLVPVSAADHRQSDSGMGDPSVSILPILFFYFFLSLFKNFPKCIYLPYPRRP